jgi:transcriptional regulator with XRE-family HTH domain
MANRKVRPHPGVLAALLKSKGLTLTDAARDPSRGTRVIDRKTLAKINRGEAVKEQTLLDLAKSLKVPIEYFFAPADNSARVDSKPEDPERLNLTLRKVDAERLMEMLSANDRVNWQLNVRTIGDETIQLLAQLETAVIDLHGYLLHGPHEAEDASLKIQLDELKKNKQVAALLDELAKHRLAILGGEYLSWESQTENLEWDSHTERRRTDVITTTTERPCTRYTSWSNVVFSIEGHSTHERRANVWQGTVPPRFAPDYDTLIYVNGAQLFIDPAIHDQRLDAFMSLKLEEEPTAPNEASREDDADV